MTHEPQIYSQARNLRIRELALGRWHDGTLDIIQVLDCFGSRWAVLSHHRISNDRAVARIISTEMDNRIARGLRIMSKFLHMGSFYDLQRWIGNKRFERTQLSRTCSTHPPRRLKDP